MFDDVETKSLFVGYGFAAIVTKAIYHTAIRNIAEVSRASPIEIFESFLVSELSDPSELSELSGFSELSKSEMDAIASISFPYNLIQQTLARLLDPIWNHPLFTLSYSLTFSQSIIERLASILRQFKRFYESHFDLNSSNDSSLNPQIRNDYQLISRLQDICGLSLHVRLPSFHSL